MTKLEKANLYIKENSHKVNNRPKIHLTPEIGWINDPNGFVYYDGKYHLFYQHFPYETKWGDMHWGHATSDDLISWEYEKVALANDTLADASGCFSGSAIVKDDKMFLMYTGHIDPNLGFPSIQSEVLQQQCLAVSTDGINFTKHENNPVISQFNLPQGYKKSDFRDPKVLKKNGIYYVVIAVKNLENRGEIMLYKSSNLIEWSFVSSIYQSKYEENMMIECPDLFTIDGKDVIIFSGMPCDFTFEEEVGNTTEYLVGTMNFITGKYEVEYRGILDYGNSFYAPQSMENPLNKRIMIGWMKKWLTKKIVVPPEFLWSGMMSIPRELSLKDNLLIQNPINSIENYLKPIASYKNIEIRNKFVLENLNFENTRLEAFNLKGFIKLLKKESITISIFESFDNAIQIIINSKDNSITYISSYDNLTEQYFLDDYCLDSKDLSFDLYVDIYSIELFLNSGEKVFSFTNFSSNRGNGISMITDGNSILKQLEINEILK